MKKSGPAKPAATKKPAWTPERRAKFKKTWAEKRGSSDNGSTGGERAGAFAASAATAGSHAPKHHQPSRNPFK